MLSSTAEAFKRNVLFLVVSLCLGKHEKCTFQVFPSAAAVVVLAGFIISPGAGRPLALRGWVCQRAGMAELGQLVCFQTRPQWFWELPGCLSEVSGASSVGDPGAQREGGVGGSVLLGKVVCSASLSGDVGRAVLCYRLSKTELACQPKNLILWAQHPPFRILH